MKKLDNFISRYREVFMTIADLTIVVFSYGLAYFIRIDFGKLFIAAEAYSLLANMIWVVLINFSSMVLFGLSRSLWLFVSIDEALRVSISVASANFFWWILVILLRIPGYIRSLPVIASMIQLLMMLGLRVSYRLIRRDSEQHNRKHRALILGAGTAGVNALREITYSNIYNTNVIGFIDKNPQKVKKRLNGIDVLGTDAQLAEIVARYRIDTVFIAIKNISHDDLKKLIEKCRDLSLTTRIVSFEMHANAESPASAVRNVSISDLLGRGELNLNNEEIGGYLSDKTVMVTGAGGSIGSELVRQIMSFNPRTVVLLDIYENHMYELQQEIVMDRRSGSLQTKTAVVCLIGSIRDKERINEIMAEYKPDVVFHAAAHKHVPLVEDSPLEAIKNNVFGTKNVIESCIAHKVSKFVMISTDKAVRTTNVMGATKRMCELLVEAYKNNGVTKLCAVRFGNVLGSSGSVIPLFEKQIASGGPVTVTDPNISRYFMTIPEAAQLVLQAGAYANTGEIFILDMGKPEKIVDLAKNLIQLSGLKLGKDIEIQFTGLRPGEKLYEELLIDPNTCTKTDNNLIYVAQPEDIYTEIISRKMARLAELIKTDQADNQLIITIITSQN